MLQNGQIKLIKLYSKFNHSESSDFRNSNLNNLVVSNLKKGSVADVGCGIGQLAISAAENKFKNVCAIDVEKELLKLGTITSKTKKVKINFIHASILNLPKNLKGKFDNVVSLDVIEHIDNDIKALINLSTIMKNNGRLIIAVPAFNFLYGQKDKEIGHYRRYSKHELEKKITDLGFVIKESRYWNFLGFFVYFISEKIFCARLDESVRFAKKGSVGSLVNKMIFYWVKHVENNIKFPIGLSILIVADKKK